jgi:hypothetical protein
VAQRIAVGAFGHPQIDHPSVGLLQQRMKLLRRQQLAPLLRLRAQRAQAQQRGGGDHFEHDCPFILSLLLGYLRRRAPDANSKSAGRTEMIGARSGDNQSNAGLAAPA